MGPKAAQVDRDRNWIGRGDGHWNDWLFGGAGRHNFSNGIAAVVTAARFLGNESLLIAIEASTSYCGRGWRNICNVGSHEVFKESRPFGVDDASHWHDLCATNWSRRAKHLPAGPCLAANGPPLGGRRFVDSLGLLVS